VGASAGISDLFLQYHYPLLQRIEKTGRMLSVKIETPANHMTEMRAGIIG